MQFFPSRSATADIEVGGTVIPEGAAVHLMYGAANRDPRRFADPDRFDVFRPDNEHFGWGSGIHTCVGGPLARLEVNLALEIFLRRVHRPRLVADPRRTGRVRSSAVRGTCSSTSRASVTEHADSTRAHSTAPAMMAVPGTARVTSISNNRNQAAPCQEVQPLLAFHPR